jgi:hypothetical protein
MHTDPINLPLTDPGSLTGGEIDPEQRRQYVELRDRIQKEKDVLLVHELARQTDGRWLYLIETPFITFPKFVIGRTDLSNEWTEILFRCGADWSARAEWDRLRHGKDGAA